MKSGVYYVAGIDSGSTSTDVVILDQDGKIKSTMIIPTGGGAMMSAEKSLDKAVEKAGIQKDEFHLHKISVPAFLALSDAH